MIKSKRIFRHLKISKILSSIKQNSRIILEFFARNNKMKICERVGKNGN